MKTSNKSYKNEEAHTMDNMVQVCRGCHRTLETYNAEKQRMIIFENNNGVLINK